MYPSEEIVNNSKRKYMKTQDIVEQGRVVKGVNTTQDVGVDAIKTNAKKLGMDVDRDGRPKNVLGKKYHMPKWSLLESSGSLYTPMTIPEAVGLINQKCSRNFAIMHNENRYLTRMVQESKQNNDAFFGSSPNNRRPTDSSEGLQQFVDNWLRQKNFATRKTSIFCYYDEPDRQNSELFYIIPFDDAKVFAFKEVMDMVMDLKTLLDQRAEYLSDEIREEFLKVDFPGIMRVEHVLKNAGFDLWEHVNTKLFDSLTHSIDLTQISSWNRSEVLVQGNYVAISSEIFEDVLERPDL